MSSSRLLTCNSTTIGYAVGGMTAQPPDPDPARTPGLEPGGGVAPGATPPESAQTSGLSEPEPHPRRRFTAGMVVGLIAIAVLVLVFLTTGILLLLNM
jgi:Family of unknown function (DUF6480)